MKLNKGKIKRCLNIISEISGVLIMIKGNPRPIDYIAISTKAIDIAARIHSELLPPVHVCAWEIFTGKDTEWRSIPKQFGAYIFQNVHNSMEHAKSTSVSSEVSFLGQYHGCEIGWVIKNEGLEGLFVKEKYFSRIFEKMYESFWSAFPRNAVVLNKENLVEDEIDIVSMVETDFIRGVWEYVEKVINYGEFGSCVLIGEPGTGKTKAIQYITEKLGLKSIRIPLKTFARSNWCDPVFDFKSILKITLPDILIIDDIDRLDYSVQKELLEFIDTSKDKIKFIIASANNINNVSLPLKRPGRFDEHIYVPPLEKEVLEKILKDNQITEEMIDWPISYVEYYQKYCRIFGREKSLELIPRLQERVEQNGKYEFDRM